MPRIVLVQGDIFVLFDRVAHAAFERALAAGPVTVERCRPPPGSS
jgi:hypothetical protein